MNDTMIYRVLCKYAKKRGIFLEENAPLPDGVNGLWYCFGGGVEVISLSRHVESLPLKNFALAHELGHSCLHKGVGNLFNRKQCREDYATAKEKEADDFARRLIDRLKSS